jgi:hypothetical protein
MRPACATFRLLALTAALPGIEERIAETAMNFSRTPRDWRRQPAQWCASAEAEGTIDHRV